jgi:hypothetical protein
MCRHDFGAPGNSFQLFPESLEFAVRARQSAHRALTERDRRAKGSGAADGARTPELD